MVKNYRKPWYEDCANHAMRFYFRHLDADVNKMTKPNFVLWRCCDEIFAGYSDEDFAIMRAVYEYRDAPMQKIIERVSLERGVTRKRIWTLLNKATHAFAKARGLI